MRQWKCSKCGEEAISKCVAERSVFPENQTAVLLRNMLDYEVSVVEKNLSTYMSGRTARRVQLALTYEGIYYDGEDHTSILSEFIQLIRGVKEHDLKIALCDHRWEIQFGECLFGCHRATPTAPIEEAS